MPATPRTTALSIFPSRTNLPIIHARTVPHSMMKLSPILAGLLVTPLLSLLAAEPVTASRDKEQIIFRTGDRELLRYQAEPGALPRPDIKEAFRRGGYLHPIYTPSGKLVTDDYPSNHVHHHGIWMPWTKTSFEGREPDFWNMGGGKGRVEFVSLGKLWSKDGRAGFSARHQFVDLLAQPSKIALNETWEVEVSAVAAQGSEPAQTIIDLTSTQTCASESPLKLPKYHYGGLGFRGNWAWNGPTEWKVLTSEGETDRNKANEKRSNWCWVGGLVDGQPAGVTILSASTNYRAPQPMRLHPKEPFFCFAPQQLGDMEIAPGMPYVSRYRFIVTDGQPTREQAESWWKTWGR